MWILMLTVAFAKGPSKAPPADLAQVSKAIPQLLGSAADSPKGERDNSKLQRFLANHTHKEDGNGDRVTYSFPGLGMEIVGTAMGPANGCPATYVATQVTVANAQRFDRLPGIDTSMTWKEAKKHLKKNDHKVKKEKEGDVVRLTWTDDWSLQRQDYGCGKAYIQRSAVLVYGDNGLRRAVYRIGHTQSPD
ncbi:MAG: hypothetical protein EP330_28380 [Deltaproteobacteria bacterium]|nr:MAG: hypothetical protein EP330_28380 [Deltaproteobacteria bacterium]